MNLCPQCWDRGRHLAVGCCICTGDVKLSTDFHVWMATKRVDHFTAPQEGKPAPPPTKTRLVFGEKPEKKRPRRR